MVKNTDTLNMRETRLSEITALHGMVVSMVE
jgi:hypothetical protein